MSAKRRVKLACYGHWTVPTRGAKAAVRRAIGGPSRGLPIALMVIQALRVRSMPPA